MNKNKKPSNKIDYRAMLERILDKNGEKLILDAYRSFHNYSITNRILALTQMEDQGYSTSSPIGTFGNFIEKGFQIPKGCSPNISLYMPLSIKKKDAKGNIILDKEGNPETSLIFVIRNSWYSLDYLVKEIGKVDPDFELPKISDIRTPDWDPVLASQTLGVRLSDEFNSTKGNAQGFFRTLGGGEGEIAINPMAAIPLKTMFHEMAHFVLDHEGSRSDLETNVKEAEAESVAALCCLSQGMSNVESYSRGYISTWLKDEVLNDASIQKIISATDKMLMAGQEKSNKPQLDGVPHVKSKATRKLLEKIDDLGIVSATIKHDHSVIIEAEDWSIMIENEAAESIINYADKNMNGGLTREEKIIQSSFMNPIFKEKLEAIKSYKESCNSDTGLDGCQSMS
ncbi:MAG: hypothetical protein IBX55_01060 [Methyloprofundus sp.]|nr:hypothetical protein [Methyloprofundus sp.]